MKASQQTLDWIREYYAHIDEGRYDECGAYFTSDAKLRIAAFPEVVGGPAIVRSMKAGLAVVKSIEHEVLNAWDEDGTLIFEVTAHYTMPDDTKIDVTGVVIATTADGKYTSQRIAVDLSPVYGRGR